jgi:hypothetical protein
MTYAVLNSHAKSPVSFYKDFFFDAAPDEIIQHIFLRCGMRELAELQSVSRRMRALARDPYIWKVFCEKLPCCYPAKRKHFSKVERAINYQLLCQRISAIPKNIENNRYILKTGTYPENASFLEISDNLICIGRLDDSIEIYNPETEKLELKIPTGPLCREKFLIVRGILESLESLIHSYRSKALWANDAVAQATPLVSNLLQYTSDEEVAHFLPLKQCLSALPFSQMLQINSEGIEKAFAALEKAFVSFSSEKIMNYLNNFNKKIFPLTPFADLYISKLSHICCFAASEHYFALGYVSGYVDVWERKSQTKICTFTCELDTPVSMYGCAFTLQFCGQQLYILERIKLGFFQLDLKTKNLTQIDFPIQDFLVKIDDQHLLTGDEGGDLYILKTETLEFQHIFKTEIEDLQEVYIDPNNTNVFVIVDQGENSFFITFFSLDLKHFKIEQKDSWELDGLLDTLCWAHGYIWIEYEGNISKISNGRLEKIFELKGSNMRFAKWFNEKFFIFEANKGIMVLDFCATEKEVLLNIAQGFKQGSDPFPLSLRLERLPELHKEGILFWFDVLRLGQFPEQWGDSTTLPNGELITKSFCSRAWENSPIEQRIH